MGSKANLDSRQPYAQEVVMKKKPAANSKKIPRSTVVLGPIASLQYCSGMQIYEIKNQNDHFIEQFYALFEIFLTD